MSLFDDNPDDMLPPLPKLPGGWYWRDRTLVYDGPDVELWARYLTSLVENPPPTSARH